jgi:hypothetical protein
MVLGMSEYGAKFDNLAERWKIVEAEHDRQHPDRGECGGVGVCSMMAAAYDLRTEMVEELEKWRKRAPNPFLREPSYPRRSRS